MSFPTKQLPDSKAAARPGPARYCAVVGVIVLLARIAAAQGSGAPVAVVEETTSGVLGILAQQGLGSDEKRRRVEEIVYTHVDFETLSRLVLARNWSRFSPEQQKDFVAEFKRHLSLTYGKRIDSYKNERVLVVGSRQESQGDWTVKTKIVRGGSDDILVDYRLRSKEEQWRIIDMIIEGVSLVANFRSQFQDAMASGGPEHILSLLREKNATSQPLKS